MMDRSAPGNFLLRLAARARGQGPLLVPRIDSLFEPWTTSDGALTTVPFNPEADEAADESISVPTEPVRLPSPSEQPSLAREQVKSELLNEPPQIPSNPHPPHRSVPADPAIPSARQVRPRESTTINEPLATAARPPETPAFEPLRQADRQTEPASQGRVTGAPAETLVEPVSTHPLMVPLDASALSARMSPSALLRPTDAGGYIGPSRGLRRIEGEPAVTTPPPVIHISIGRVEVRATPLSTALPQRKLATGSQRLQSLSDYLGKRERER